MHSRAKILEHIKYCGDAEPLAVVRVHAGGYAAGMPQVLDARVRLNAKDSATKLRRDVWSLLWTFFELARPDVVALAEEFGLTLQQAAVLRALGPGRSISMNELAGMMDCDASNVTGIINRLEARGLIKRRPSAADRRYKMLTLTKAGAECRNKMHARLIAPGPSLMGFSQPELEQLQALLAKLNEQQRSATQISARIPWLPSIDDSV